MGGQRQAVLDYRFKPGNDIYYSLWTSLVITGLDPVIQGSKIHYSQTTR